jgi:hypothetical protein
MRQRDELRLFTVEEANRALSLVRRIMADIMEENALLQELLPQLKEARQMTRRYGPDPSLEALREEVASISARLEGYLKELSQVGCLFKGPQGLVDFYALQEGRPVFLCWRYGEPEVGYWHELDDGFAGRRPIKEGFLAASPSGHEPEG